MLQSKGVLPVDVRRVILSIYQSLGKSEMLEKCLHSKTQTTNELFNEMIWNYVPKATHVGLDVLSVGVYHATDHFNNGEKVALDIMELLKIDPGYYMTKCSRSVNMHRKCSSYSYDVGNTEKTSEGAASFQKEARRQKH